MVTNLRDVDHSNFDSAHCSKYLFSVRCYSHVQYQNYQLGIQAHAYLLNNKFETLLQHPIQPIRLLQVLNVEQSSTSLQRIYCNLSTQPCCYEFHCMCDMDFVLYHFLLYLSVSWMVGLPCLFIILLDNHNYYESCIG